MAARSPHDRKTGSRSGDARAAAGSGPFERFLAVLARGVGEAELGPALRELGGPAELDRLFRAALVAGVRRGPVVEEESWAPARLIEVATRAARCSALPVGTAPGLRRVLEELEERLRGEGLWCTTTALWWRPLPRPGELEEVWSALDSTARPGAALPGAEELSHALTAPAGSGWTVARSVIGEGLLRRVSGELAGLGAGGVLELSRGGVGAENRTSPERSDRVAYVTGLEPELLAAAPSVAVLVQWLLRRLTPSVAACLPAALHPPVSAMVARYEAPCRGFAPHLDNPGGEQDNGRALTLVLYLNAPEAPCTGGELGLWGPGRPDPERSAEVVPAAGGSMALFDSRRVVHEVLPLRPGPDRWTVVVWLSDAARSRPSRPEPPALTPAEVLEPLGEEVAVPAGRVVLRSLVDEAGADEAVAGATVAGETAAGGAPDRPGVPQGIRWQARSVRPAAQCPAVGIVCTTDRAGERLESWCRHHLDAGADHLVVALDRTATPTALERARGLAEKTAGRITVWSAAEAEERWPGADSAGSSGATAALRTAAEQGAATHAVAARQALNATAALEAARAGALGGAPLDWLLHLDDDELLLPQGSARGGASLGEHFAALAALRRRDPGRFAAVRYVNHELLLTRGGGPVRFKRNPLVAAARLGPLGWRRLVAALGMEQAGRRPYFRAYWNGKSAVAVAAGRAAAGVHGWAVGPDGASGASAPLIAGPSILHLHLPTAGAFRRKYTRIARAPAVAAAERPFPPSPLEERAVALVRDRYATAVAGTEREVEEGREDGELARRLDALYAEELCAEQEVVEILDAAGLLFAVDLDLAAWLTDA